MVARAYIRHPADMPIEFSPSAANDLSVAKTHDISLGGLSFSSPKALPVGSVVTVKIPVVSPAFEAKAKVIWCISRPDTFEAGIEFVDVEDAYKARMVEQICHIEHYRMWVKEVEGRDLDTEAAAVEWIDKFAKDFPRLS
jgi:hypothetical protein